MEVDASETSQILNPPPPPPVPAPPPHLDQPPTTATHVSDGTGAIATLPGPASGFYQDPYSSFSQYGAAQQTDPQVLKLLRM